MAKNSQRYILKRASKRRIRNKNLKSKAVVSTTGTQVLGSNSFHIQAETKPEKSQPALDYNPEAKANKRKRGAYLVGFGAVILIGFLVFLLVNNLTLALDIPENGLNSVATLQGVPVTPAAFVSNNMEMEGVYAEFRDPYAIDFMLSGRHEVALILRNGRRVSEATMPLYVLVPLMYVEVEAGTYISPQEFVHIGYITPGTVIDITIHDGLPAGVLGVGEHTVNVSINGVFFYSQVRVLDTTPPTATLDNIIIPMGQDILPDDFIIDYFDISPVVAIEFVHEPYVFAPGAQDVEIMFTDYFGNSAVYLAQLYVLPNIVPPQIVGAQDLYVQVGSPIIFRRGISAMDAFGRPLAFSVDSTDVNIRELGTYTAIYYTQDAWGLRTEVLVYVHVLEVDPDRVRNMADMVLESILHEGMTQVEQAQAIFDWISNNIAYAADVSRTSMYDGAYQALRNRRGDCFVFYSVSEMLLTQAGIPNLHIQRIEGTFTRHSWNLINPDGLGWHHFDTTPLRPIFGQRLNRFMFTSSQARRSTELILSYLGMRDYYTYYPELYPEIEQ
ncbi:MAG: transglutaminase domain-containing protein [Defluviitaleaceae bacterium]|nr:transglutaminase domain-containing protein [Defluviitaleaceae bacterium]